MYNQEINDFYVQLITTTQNNLNSIKEYTNYIDNALHCLMGFFNTKQNNKYNNSSIVIEEEEKMTKRKDNRYVKTINIGNTRKYIYGKTKKDCLEKYQSIIKENKNILLKNTNKTTLTIDWLKEWYITFKKNFISDKSRKDIENIINNKLQFFHNKPINKITTTMLQQYFNEIPKTRTKEKTILYFNASLDKAYNLGKIKNNPFNAFIKEKKINTTKPAFTFEEQEKIINAIKGDKIEIAILIYLITGLRKNELNFKNLEKDLNIKNKTLKAINLKQREDEPPYKIIDLSNNAISYILNNIKQLKELNENIVYRRFKKILEDLNINGNIHTLRHTFGTNCMYLGIPTKIYSSWLGHSTTKITEDIYTSIDKNITKEKINKLYNNLYVNFD